MVLEAYCSRYAARLRDDGGWADRKHEVQGPVIVGRQKEVAALGTLIDRARTGLTVLLVEGEPGIGKTALLREGIRLADAAGFSVLSCGGSAAESFGNIFTGEADMDLNACRGDDKKAAGPGTGFGGGLNLRDCTWPDPDHPGQTMCGFKYAGDCASFAFDPEPYSCKSQDDLQGFYDDCHATPGDGRWPGSKTYREVITVYTSAL